MNRHAVFVGLIGLGLSAAGCASGRSGPLEGVPGLSPVGLGAVPPIHETINGRNAAVPARSPAPGPVQPAQHSTPTMPTAPAMIRFCTTARTWRPQRDLYRT